MEPDYEIAIIGTGIGGLAVGAKLRQAGREDFVMIDRADDIGGTWRDNTYPGVAVDIPSFAYQYSFYRNPDWSQLYAPGAEVKAYLDHFCDDMGLRPYLRLNTDVVGRHWDEENHVWRLQLKDGGEITARWCVGALGSFPAWAPLDFPGIEDYQGKIIRSQQWDHDYDLSGKRVANVGTGASGLQIIPELAKVASHVDVYQRTPIWVAAKKNPPIAPWLQRLMKVSPTVSKLMYKFWVGLVEFFVVKATTQYAKRKWLIRSVRKAVTKSYAAVISDPELLEKLTPTYEYGCKRPSFSNEYLQTFLMDHVELVTDPIERFVPEGIRTVDGTVRPIDAVVLATGFIGANDARVYRLHPITGRDGFDLAEEWETNRKSAYEGLMHPKLPNHFTVFGPYSGVAGTFHPLCEIAGDFVVRITAEADRRGATAVEVTEEAHRAYHNEMLRGMNGALWYHASCDSSRTYYYDQHGDVTLIRPTLLKDGRRRANTFTFDHFHFDTHPIPDERSEPVEVAV